MSLPMWSLHDDDFCSDFMRVLKHPSSAFFSDISTWKRLCLSKISKYLSGWRLYSFHNSIILADAHFSHDIPRHTVFALPCACCPSAREPGSAPPNRRASEVRRKTVEIDSSGPSVVDLPVPPGARRCPSSSQKRSLLGTLPAFGCSGRGRCGTANPDDPSFRARSEI